MSNLSSSVTDTRIDAKATVDAVWDYTTSLKAVKKVDGNEQAFSSKKLAASIVACLKSAGQKDDHGLSDKLIEQILSRLVRIFDGHTIPRTADIREVINVTFIDHNLVHVAKNYMNFRYDAHKKSTEPVYGHGLTFERYFTKEGVHPYDEIEWEKRTAKITGADGEIIFEQNDVEVPDFWSQTSTNIVVQKYFRGKIGNSDRETSVKQLIDRVAKTFAAWGRKDGYFQTAKDADIFEDELIHILINQMAAFNSPVWFNVGVSPKPQCSACFINSVQDDMRSILHLCMTEGMIFKHGSGTGTNLSTLRSSKEYMGGSNGKSSGPISFMKGLDAFAGVIKSGGKTRRAAKMVMLNIDHPDIEDFIKCKAEEEKKAWALMDAGYDGSMDGPAYSSIFFQNANNSIRVTEEFLDAVRNDGEWNTYEVTTGKVSETYKAKDLMRMAAEAAWQCGDPGIQYDTEINKWHTCKNSDRIHGSNPCSEYVFLDDTACNLASLNLLKIRKEVNGRMEFDVEAFEKVARTIITAMEITIGNSSYPTPSIEHRSLDFRPLGIGYANLGALLMSRGLPYDSEEGRNLAGAITSFLSGVAYHQSALIAEKRGPFNGFALNREPCLEVMRMHRDASRGVPDRGVPADLQVASHRAWDQVVEDSEKFGLRNAQISVLAPTGTIGFFMGCDTTGIEPDIALVKYKWLVGGGMIKIVNQTVPEALERLGYTAPQVTDIMEFIDKQDTIEGAPHIKEEHLSVFDCAFKAKNGTRTIHYLGHLRMMAATQPFLSGAISKTVNMPNEATVDDIMEVYMEGARLGLKAIAIYRDGSKRVQALTTSLDTDQSGKAKKETNEVAKPRRRRLPDERRSITHTFTIGNHKGYITVGLYDDGTPGEVFITMAKEGSVVSGLMDSFATTISIALQYGVPLQTLVNKYVHKRFEPSGYTSNERIRIAKSIVDYIGRWLALKFLSPEEQMMVGLNTAIAPSDAPEAQPMGNEEVPAVSTNQKTLFSEKPSSQPSAQTATLAATFDNQADAPACDTCGTIMIRNGSCYKCMNCGSTSGCS